MTATRTDRTRSLTLTSVPLDADAPWADRAHCLGIDADVMFPEPGEDPAEAKAVCAGCPVRDECLAHAQAAGERYGVWGGLTADERLRLAGFRRAARKRHHRRTLRTAS